MTLLENKMVAAVLLPTVSFRDESSREDWQVLSRIDSKKKILVKQTSMLQSEREISMDPKSIRSLSMSGSMRRNDSFDMILLPAMSPPRDLDSPMPLPLQPVRTKFLSRSLPNSTAASPRQRSGLMRSLKNKEQDSSSAAYKRSKSCGSSSKRLSLKRNSFFIKTESNKSISNNNTLEDGFKCNALCLYLPGFGKGKPIRSSRKDDSSSFTRTTTTTMSSSSTITVSRTVSVRESTTTTTVISARASMEKFDCGSYTSESGGEEGGNHFYDLPSELIKSGSGDNDHDDPVSAAFVFDKEPVEKEIKGVLKVSGSKNRKSMESSSLRQVRFSTSSPVSYPTSPAISPRLLEASKNFNAFLEAQAV
ncbi:PREDICTED: uncharacterized protein LOC104724965 isoform X2 [Camelina sativa]|uniref:Uncharacterized protein LOC104724965 isoform X2 n=1 Tax=Camelina sativa TaxID=90675 RepID=A0ABM0UIZ9_CAMSA|nr:PREDICTED: uncharacterized protein LOC104724965 isoform X2 [Camelina sativa]